jgi:coenzyme Q-binding protein COQ10
MPAGSFSIQSDLKSEDLMATILDFGSYPDFIDVVDKVETRLDGPPVWEVYFEIKVIRKLTYTLRLEKKNNNEVSWSLIDGFFITNSGCWKLTPNAQGTEVFYQVSMQMDTFLPSMIKKTLSAQLLPRTVNAFILETKARVALQKIDSTDN